MHPQPWRRVHPVPAGVGLRPVASDDPREILRTSPAAQAACAVAVVATRCWAAGEVVGPYAAWVTIPPEFDATVALMDRAAYEAFAVTSSTTVPVPHARAAAAAAARPQPGGGDCERQPGAAGADAAEGDPTCSSEPLVFCAYPPECAGHLAQLNDWRADPDGAQQAAAGSGGPAARKRGRDGAAATAGGGGYGADCGEGGIGPNCQLVRFLCLCVCVCACTRRFSTAAGRLMRRTSIALADTLLRCSVCPHRGSSKYASEAGYTSTWSPHGPYRKPQSCCCSTQTCAAALATL